MIKIAVQTGGPQHLLTLDETYRSIKEAGFDAVDANINEVYPGVVVNKKIKNDIFLASDKEYLNAYKPWGDAAKKYGLDNYQAHASFPSLVADETGEFNDYLLEMLRKSIIACDYIGCRNLVIHPFFRGYQEQMDPQTEWDVNIERYSALIPTAKEYGVTICLENMFTSNRGRNFAACCSDITTACRYVDTLNDLAGQKCFGFCLDTGHLLLLGIDVKNAMVQLGNRIQAFHIHDNNGLSDQHLAPYMGVQDWERFWEGLKAIHFDKTISFETFNIWRTIDPALCQHMLCFVAKAGRLFAQRAMEG